jgi:energy-coupling factor transporter ATP-binding protein EcfA2
MNDKDNGHNGHNNHGLGLDSITPQFPMPDLRGVSSEQSSSSGLKGKHLEKVRCLDSESTEQEAIVFRQFPDGTLVELMRDTSKTRPRFLVWKNGRAKMEDNFKQDDRLFVPPLVDPSLMSAIRLPSALAPHGGLADLVRRVQDCISTYVDLAPQDVRLSTNIILHTWFADCSTVTPYLWVTGPSGAGKTTLLRLLHCLCRRAVLASDLSLASLYLLSSTMMPTLLIDEFESGSGRSHCDVLRLLRSGSTQGASVCRAGKTYLTFCPKVISSRTCPTDDALASRVIFVSMLPARRPLPELDLNAQKEISKDFQGQFLDYRLRNYSRIATKVTIEMPNFAPRMRDLARALAAPLQGHREVEQQLLDDLEPLNEEAKFSRHGEPEWAVATALFRECHCTTGSITVGSLTGTVHEVLERMGETYGLTPRAVGHVLRTLKLPTCKLGHDGRGLRITQELIKKVHQLACDLGINKSDILSYQTVDAGYAGSNCQLCDDYGLLMREDGTKLRTHLSRKPGKGCVGTGLYSQRIR